jgi:uncharacterized cofD-like protein
MALEPLDIEGTFKTWEGTHVVRGQKEVAVAKGTLENLALIPTNPTPTKEGLDAIAQADFITIGPGSWFSSVLPHVLVGAQRDALIQSSARKVIVLNLDAAPHMRGDELAGSSPADHLRVLQKYAPGLGCDIALVDKSIGSQSQLLSELDELVAAMGGRVFVADVAMESEPNHHDHAKLFSAFSHIFQSEMIR